MTASMMAQALEAGSFTTYETVLVVSSKKAEIWGFCERSSVCGIAVIQASLSFLASRGQEATFVRDSQTYKELSAQGKDIFGRGSLPSMAQPWLAG
jgi:hypothetical protein